MRSVKQPAALPMLALTAWLAMPAHAADGEFAVGQDFLTAEPTQTRSLPGADLQTIKHLPAKTLSELMAAARGQLPLDRKAPPIPLVVNPEKPLVYVAGPKTGGALTPVVLPDDMKARELEEEEILREAEAALKMDLPVESTPRPIPMAKAAAPAPVKQVQRPATVAGARLELVEVGNELRISPKTLRMSLQDDGIHVVDKNLRDAPQIFLRNSRIVRWDAARKKIDAQDKGRTELYVTYRDQLYIVPIEVGGGAHRDPLLASDGPASFQKLTSVLPLMDQPYASYGDAPAASLSAPEVPADTQQKSRQPLTLATSVAQVEATRERDAAQQARFFYPDSSPDYRTIDIQVMDERSVPERPIDPLVYPISNVSVRILGTKLVNTTSANGHAKFGEIPEGSRFFLEIRDDEKGRIVPTVTEMALYNNSRDQVLRARTMDYADYVAYQNIVGVTQHVDKASLCARVMAEDGTQPLPGYRVFINDENAHGPHYVNELGGWPQPTQHETDSTGRFCFFNVKPGLVELTFEKGKFQTSLSMPVFAGAHTEEDLPLLSNDNGRVFLAAAPSAVDQIYEERAAVEQPLQPIDFVDMITIGDNRDMARVGDAILGYEESSSLFKGRLYTMAKAPEFETALYTFDRDKQVRRTIPVAPLLQRGYVQDVFHELAGQDNGQTSIALDAIMGAVLVLHRSENGASPVRVSLVDREDQVYDQGWSYGSTDQGLSRTIFFNMKPGVYSVIVESEQGAILSLDTIAVDFLTTSVVQSGSTVHYNPQQARRED